MMADDDYVTMTIMNMTAPKLHSTPREKFRLDAVTAV
jgi:hypothetical protein